ncbi:uncharacterized protein LOC143049502 [Mytilus galloprovincialis]
MGQMKVRTNIDELQKRKAEMKDVDSNELSKFENTMKRIKIQNVLLKKEVDQHTEKLETELTKKWEEIHMYTEKGQTEANLLIGSLESKNLKVDDIIQSMDAKKFFVDGVGLVKAMDEADTPPCTKFDSIPIFFPGQITAYNVGSLEKASTKDEIKIIKKLHTQIADVFYMAMADGSGEELWITDQKVLQKVKIEGNSLRIVAQKDIKIFGMAVCPSKDLLLVKRQSLKQISDQTSEVTQSKYEVKGLRLSAVHVNSDGSVTVGAYSGKVVYPAAGRRVVIVMDINGKHETTFEYDRQGNHIFTYVKNITRTKNGNTCVVDKLSEDNRARVVILSEDGDVLNIFNGHPEVNTDKIPFKPIRIITTPIDTIVVSSHNINFLFFINNCGNLIRWCNMSEIGIFYVNTFCISKSGRIYIGCGTPEGSSDNAKIYEVNILDTFELI